MSKRTDRGKPWKKRDKTEQEMLLESKQQRGVSGLKYFGWSDAIRIDKGNKADN
ncbi:hypothetical protein Pmar_PMAR016408 [Perkinsus marinus ATCC 50983]|uniref:Uncharacterized protein n=1 Tax=Perkinsus marinus (strain ATCC 50983 / TXsc) TaxID=423536 RepID=C5L170_PERM5|nr:hypothetical protein Pmar_PMAR016408 [Perkinsus marinus ATCC 50983]EER09477.1 hypothetical protein Pmar_PMAR016408 [Perkinsus marinus ATCC 50983]|eukprot:XP_002777661.1 hypothetical protein Pmar_PMAR016408 [Perkinsus marinus ATCC 50983]